MPPAQQIRSGRTGVVGARVQVSGQHDLRLRPAGRMGAAHPLLLMVIRHAAFLAAETSTSVASRSMVTGPSVSAAGRGAGSTAIIRSVTAASPLSTGPIAASSARSRRAGHTARRPRPSPRSGSAPGQARRRAPAYASASHRTVLIAVSGQTVASVSARRWGCGGWGTVRRPGRNALAEQQLPTGQALMSTAFTRTRRMVTTTRACPG